MNTKTCNKCGTTVSLEKAKATFVLNKDCTDGIRPLCKKCKYEQQNQHKYREDEEYRIKEIEKNRSRSDKYYESNVKSILDYYELAIPTCSICGHTDEHFAPFDLHHLDPSQKKFGIHKKIDKSPFNNWKEELEKCVLVCSNCHRKIHSRRCNA